MMLHILTLSLALVGVSPLDHTQSLSATKAATAPPLDASLSSPVWQHAAKAMLAENFNDRSPAKHITTAYLLYDDKNLYVGFHAEQRGIPITASQTVDHAGVASDDHVTLALDTAGNGARVYTFRANAKGVHDESSSENVRYAPDWTSVASITPNGDYNVMMIVPLRAMHIETAGLQHWRINLCRYIARTNDLLELAYEPTQTDPSLPQYWPSLTGMMLSGTSQHPRAHADLYALVSAGSQHNVFQNGIGSFQSTRTRSMGVDLTVPLTNTLSLVATVNPDFSNVEKDQTTIAPQQFARNYSEYRPFFAQGARYINAVPEISVGGITDTLFYSPSIGIFERGYKIEGTAGRSSIGVLNVAGAGFNDTALGYGFTTPDQTLDLSTEAVMANHTGVKDDAVAAGLSLHNRHSGMFTIAKAEGDDNSSTGHSHYLFASEGVNSATWFAAIDYRDISESFNPIDGYTAFTDIRGPRLGLNYNGVAKKGSAIKSYSIGGLLDRFVDHSGAVKEYDANFGAYVLLQNQLSFQMNGGTSALRLEDNPGSDLTPFNLTQLTVGYKDGTPAPIDVSYAWGPFGGAYLQQSTLSTSQSFGPYSVSFEYDGSVERGAPAGRQSQWLRRVSFGRSFGRNTTLALSYRDINGTGGYATPGSNLSFLYHKRFNNGDEFYLDFGTPAAPKTLHRFVTKYVFHVGGATGT